MSLSPTQNDCKLDRTAEADTHRHPTSPLRPTSRFCEVDTRPVLVNDSGDVVELPSLVVSPMAHVEHPYHLYVPGLPHSQFSCSHSYEAAMILAAAVFGQAPPQGLSARVYPGFESKLCQDTVDDGLPHTSSTTFDFRISWPHQNGMQEEDGRQICEAVDWVVKNMIADKTFRRWQPDESDFLPQNCCGEEHECVEEQARREEEREQTPETVVVVNVRAATVPDEPVSTADEK